MKQEVRISMKKTKVVQNSLDSYFLLLDSKEGFTLIELLIYLSIVSVMLISLVTFAWNIIGGGVKSATEQEVFANARSISEQLKYQIRNASGINSVATNQISLATATSGTNPTVISLSGSNLQMAQGGGGAVNLNSQNASISGVVFTNYSSADNKTKNIQFTFIVSASYSGGLRQEFNESTTISSSAEVRSN